MPAVYFINFVYTDGYTIGEILIITEFNHTHVEENVSG